MKYLVKKDKIKRAAFYDKEIIITVLKHLKKNVKINKSIRWKVVSLFFSFNSNKFKTKLINRCVISGKQRGVLSKFKVSRILFAKYSYSGKFFSLKNYS